MGKTKNRTPSNKIHSPSPSPAVDMGKTKGKTKGGTSHTNRVYCVVPTTKGRQSSTARLRRPYARPNEPQSMPATVVNDFRVSQEAADPVLRSLFPTSTLRPPRMFATPPHPYDPIVGVHPPLSPREIHRRQQMLQSRRLVCLFSIVSRPAGRFLPQFGHPLPSLNFATL
ncbi:hypothetical protein H0H92_001144 [Tricholoma furcatifolium]|nr:hypothetical protein H0H92_001144 [Tricholoma furcatifolium]